MPCLTQQCYSWPLGVSTNHNLITIHEMGWGLFWSRADPQVTLNYESSGQVGNSYCSYKMVLNRRTTFNIQRYSLNIWEDGWYLQNYFLYVRKSTWLLKDCFFWMVCHNDMITFKSVIISLSILELINEIIF